MSKFRVKLRGSAQKRLSGGKAAASIFFDGVSPTRTQCMVRGKWHPRVSRPILPPNRVPHDPVLSRQKPERPPYLFFARGFHYFILFSIHPPPSLNLSRYLCYVCSCFVGGTPCIDEQCTHFSHAHRFRLSPRGHDSGRKIASLRTTQLDGTVSDTTKVTVGPSESQTRADEIFPAQNLGARFFY